MNWRINKGYYKSSKFGELYDFKEINKTSNLLDKIIIRLQFCYFLYSDKKKPESRFTNLWPK